MENLKKDILTSIEQITIVLNKKELSYENLLLIEKKISELQHLLISKQMEYGQYYEDM